MSAITPIEFTHLLSACRPPSGWGKSITVALSGGPDSICLLSLLHRARLGLPLRSITIDHALQPTSRDSALRTRARSEAIGVPGLVLPAEWDRAIPKEGEAVEGAARDARYRALWRGLQLGEGSGTVMFGHHADDQVETVIMRVLRGTGDPRAGDLRTEYPLRGMQTYISRPLLTVPKERILATCRAHNLEYEQDVTNFMPGLTVRNAVRHVLTNRPVDATLTNGPIPADGLIHINGIRGPVTLDKIQLAINHERILATCRAHNLEYEQDVTNFMPNLTSISTDAIQSAIRHVHILAGGTGTPDLNLVRAYVGKMSERSPTIYEYTPVLVPPQRSSSSPHNNKWKQTQPTHSFIAFYDTYRLIHGEHLQAKPTDDEQASNGSCKRYSTNKTKTKTHSPVFVQAHTYSGLPSGQDRTGRSGHGERGNRVAGGSKGG
ncbi:unnamed protein product [Rhizoctonia solani]|uniref:tRNA(Ile)-lysidine synthetase n=1 Tax=Rhizoctonia solani TaxID=456999 RepID=A0A8H3HFQ1_9AGAM|nr:unnamed protein product [Rhizoctonia solani]